MYISYQNIEGTKNKIFNMVKRDYISNEDLEFLCSRSFIDMEKYVRDNNIKCNILLQIYLNPYLLCCDRLLEEKSDLLEIELISKLLIKRYNEELNEYSVKYQAGEINNFEFNNNVMFLKSLYFTSTTMGQMIYRKYSQDILKIDNGNRFLKDNGNILLKKKRNCDKIK